MSDVISVSGLRKSFGRTVALDGLDLAIREGEVHGFLGPNGSGKSTTIRVLLGLLRHDAGEVRLLGGDPWRDVRAFAGNGDGTLLYAETVRVRRRERRTSTGGSWRGDVGVMPASPTPAGGPAATPVG